MFFFPPQFVMHLTFQKWGGKMNTEREHISRHFTKAELQNVVVVVPAGCSGSCSVTVIWESFFFYFIHCTLSSILKSFITSYKTQRTATTGWWWGVFWYLTHPLMGTYVSETESGQTPAFASFCCGETWEILFSYLKRRERSERLYDTVPERERDG